MLSPYRINEQKVGQSRPRDAVEGFGIERHFQFNKRFNLVYKKFLNKRKLANDM